MSSGTGINFDCLPGYQFLECMSRSPFGETWKARAPDGRLRAVKFITSFIRDETAVTPRELDAAVRLKKARHPALACIERVEMDQGRLVLVRELAEQSMRDRCEECRSAGMPGIPRRELLGYLRSVAEGLDYLDRQHSIQHLALNPYFNILLDKGRVLLTDFGLVQLLWIPAGQPLAQINTRYSAPELFRERLSRTSDQYSLALIFYEMLLGGSPHKGSTTRVLIESRLRDEPNVELVPVDDREILAQALDRDPRRRYSSCTEFIRALEANTKEPPERPVPRLFINGPPMPPPHAAPALLEQTINALVRQAMTKAHVHEYHGMRYVLGADGVLRHKCGAWLPAGVARQKLQGFLQEWHGDVVRDQEDFFLFRVDLGGPRNFWRRLTAQANDGIQIQVRLSRSHSSPAKLTEVGVEMSYLGRNREDGINLLERTGPVMLESLRTHLVASLEQRSEERFPFEYPLRVSCPSADLQTTQVVECRGKDISFRGIGFYAPAEIPKAHIYISHTSTPGLTSFAIPAEVVRVQSAGQSWYEVGAVFLFHDVSRPPDLS